MEFKTVIGLEIHVETKTKSKMFSCSPNGFSREQNFQVTPFDLAHPGTLPLPNKQAMIHAIRVAHALHMDIDPLVRFDRKHYFYADLPKGYQITQQRFPLAKNGYLDIVNEHGDIHRIGIERLHMEEDTCKMAHGEERTFLDYNRAGTPLIEIVTRPEISSGFEARQFVETIRRIVVYAEASDGKMEEGSLRCDVNVSVCMAGYSSPGTKVEIKNLNSLCNIEDAIDGEVKRQVAALSEGGRVLVQTRRYDETRRQTVLMREKGEATDYRYLPETNIPPIRLSTDFIRGAIETRPELYDAKRERYLSLGVSSSDAERILSSLSCSKYFDTALETGASAKTLGKLFVTETFGYLNQHGMDIDGLPLSPIAFGEIVKKQDEGYTHSQVKRLFRYCVDHPTTPVEEGVAELGIQKPIDDSALLRNYVAQTLDENPQSIADYKAGKDRALGYLVGQAMKKSHGQSNPSMLTAILKEEMDKR